MVVSHLVGLKKSCCLNTCSSGARTCAGIAALAACVDSFLGSGSDQSHVVLVLVPTHETPLYVC